MTHKKCRPKLKITLSPIDKLLEIIGWCVLAGMWIAVIMVYSKLPEIIPTHYNAEGIVDGFGNKDSIWALLSVGSALFIGLTMINRMPHIFNYLTPITKENALRQYTTATKMIRVLKLAIVVIIGVLVFKTISIAIGEAENLGRYFTPITFGIIFIPLVYYIIILIKKK